VLLSELLIADRIKVPLGSRSKEDVLRELVELVTPRRDGQEADAVLASVREREKRLSTGIGAGVAIPHGKTTTTDELILAAGVSPHGIDFDAPDGRPVRLFFLLVGPERASGEHVKALSRIARLARRQDVRTELMAATSADAFLRLVRSSEAA
jgi:mannitol/fructose-specific phosphotransferase system IIA component (Ntr-type)